MKKLPILLLFSAILSLSVTAQGQKTIAKEIDDYIKPFVEKKQFAGVILATKDGKTVYEKSFGLANAEFNIPNQTNTRFGIASITKPMTSVILLRLIEAKKVALGDKLSKYIPDFPNGDKITVEMLARHRSGIPHRVMPPEMETVAYTSAEMVEKIKQAKLEFEPGTKSLYSSAGYTVLARVLEIASGKTYSQLLQEFVFTPAGMKDSLDFNGEMIMERRAQDYLLDGNGYFNAPLKDYSFLIGAGSVFSTGSDVYKFGEAFINGKYGEFAKANWVNNGIFSASGSTNGHRAAVKINSEKKYGYVLLSNLNTGAIDLILQALENILEGKAVPAPAVPNPQGIPLSSNSADFAGFYKSDNGNSFEVSIKNSAVYAGDRKLLAVKPDCFFDFKSYGDICFVRDDTGKIKHLTWKSVGYDAIYIRQ